MLGLKVVDEVPQRDPVVRHAIDGVDGVGALAAKIVESAGRKAGGAGLAHQGQSRERRHQGHQQTEHNQYGQAPSQHGQSLHPARIRLCNDAPGAPYVPEAVRPSNEEGPRAFARGPSYLLTLSQDSLRELWLEACDRLGSNGATSDVHRSSVGANGTTQSLDDCRRLQHAVVTSCCSRSERRSP